MKRHILFIVAVLAVILAYAWFVGILFLTRQTDTLLITSIIGATFSLWGTWNTFVHKKIGLCMLIVAVLLFSLCLFYLAVVDVVNPELVSLL